MLKIEILKRILKKNHNIYSPDSDIYNYLRKLDIPTIKLAKIFIFNEIEANKDLKAAIIELYPTFLEDKKEYENYQEQRNQISISKKKTSSCHSNNFKISDLDFLKLILKKKEDKKYYSNLELASLLNYTESTISKKRVEILEKFNNDDNFKEYVIENYREVLEDLKIYKIESKYEKRRISIEFKYSEFLKLIYQKKEDGTYRNVSEIIEILGISYNCFLTRKSIIQRSIESNQELKNKVIKVYPTLMEDMKNYENAKLYDLNKKEAKVAELVLSDKTKDIFTYNEISEKLNVSYCYSINIESSALFKIVNNPTLKNIYPTAVEEATIRSKAPRKQILLSQDELQNISVNSQKLEESARKNSLVNGIKQLEKSIYKDYVLLCDNKHKTMLALRLGFFNRTIFSSEDIAKLFNVSKDEVDLITRECLKVCIKDEDNKIIKNLKKKNFVNKKSFHDK